MRDPVQRKLDEDMRLFGKILELQCWIGPRKPAISYASIYGHLS